MFVGVLVGLNEALRPVNYRTESVATGMQSQKSHQLPLVGFLTFHPNRYSPLLDSVIEWQRLFRAKLQLYRMLLVCLPTRLYDCQMNDVNPTQFSAIETFRSLHASG